MKTIIEQLKNDGFKYFIGVLLTNNKIIHIVGYDDQPTKTNIDELIEELKIDVEFGLTSLIFEKDYTIINIYENDIFELDELFDIGSESFENN